MILEGKKIFRCKLPMELRKEKGERKFKHRLKRYLLDHPYYTLQQFLSGQQNKNLL
jgi:hypothetical protein